MTAGEACKQPEFGEGILQGLREAVAWKRGELVLEVVSAEVEQRPPRPDAGTSASG